MYYAEDNATKDVVLFGIPEFTDADLQIVYDVNTLFFTNSLQHGYVYSVSYFSIVKASKSAQKHQLFELIRNILSVHMWSMMSDI